MKVIVTGATGLIGSEVLAQALRHPGVTQVVALTRRQLPAHLAAHDKLATVLIDDFEQYPDEVMKKLEGAGGCAWALGLAKPGEGGLDQYRRINVTYLQRGLETFGTKLAPQVAGGAKFRFAYVGGAFSVNDSEKKQSLWVLGDARRVRGESEALALEAPKSAPSLETYVFRPAYVLGSGSGLVHNIFGSYSIKLDELAAALLEAVLKGTDKQTLENADIIELGKKARQDLQEAK